MKEKMNLADAVEDVLEEESEDQSPKNSNNYGHSSLPQISDQKRAVIPPRFENEIDLPENKEIDSENEDE
jgi:hypothetical protein